MGVRGRDAQAVINKAEAEIPVKEEELKQHNIKCKHEITKMVTRLKIVMGDIAIMTMILETYISNHGSIFAQI